ncbi:hypothetical protein T07_7171 [Trichinella nelsoni]|uniref:Uncharacterized protein n=1 Tax=Trichinella nelsoni TaxID=6336 RepID=A0A0V0S6Q6_9BILA|nr:hypothetical protein T07_7171 [Trichinella nelsoni]
MTAIRPSGPIKQLVIGQRQGFECENVRSYVPIDPETQLLSMFCFIFTNAEADNATKRLFGLVSCTNSAYDWLVHKRLAKYDRDLVMLQLTTVMGRMSTRQFWLFHCLTTLTLFFTVSRHARALIDH